MKKVWKKVLFLFKISKPHYFLVLSLTDVDDVEKYTKYFVFSSF